MEQSESSLTSLPMGQSVADPADQLAALSIAICDLPAIYAAANMLIQTLMEMLQPDVPESDAEADKAA